MYLEPIFSAQDIQKQLPGEYRAFDHVHKQLREVMRRTRERPNALQTACSTSEQIVHDQPSRTHAAVSAAGARHILCFEKRQPLHHHCGGAVSGTISGAVISDFFCSLATWWSVQWQHCHL
jgi:hypothetical protein